MAKKALSIYLAGPFFNETQVATIKRLETLLESLGFEVYSPSRDGAKLDISNDSAELRAKTFSDNIKHLSAADIVECHRMHHKAQAFQYRKIRQEILNLFDS